MMRRRGRRSRIYDSTDRQDRLVSERTLPALHAAATAPAGVLRRVCPVRMHLNLLSDERGRTGRRHATMPLDREERSVELAPGARINPRSSGADRMIVATARRGEAPLIEESHRPS